jgi:hypothetical protein
MGAHACPSLQQSAAKSFVNSLEDIVAEEDAANSQTGIQATGFPISQLRQELEHMCAQAGESTLMDSIANAFSRYGEVGQIDIRVSDGVVCHARVIFTAITEDSMRLCESTKTKICGGQIVLQSKETRAGQFAVGVATISLPGA